MTKVSKSRGLYPDYCFSFVKQISVDWLAERHLKGLLLDIDNTITRWEEITVPEGEMEWLDGLQSAGIKVRLLSNGLARKKAAVTRQTGIEMVSGIFPKPVHAAFKSGLSDLHLPADQVMMIGDSVFTDIVGANRAGIWTCLVEPLSSIDFFGSKLYRMLELLLQLRRPRHARRDYRVSE